MKVELESTTKLITIVIDGKAVPARIWQGQTANGVPCHAFITRIAVDKKENAEEFERELKEQAVPRAEFEVYPLRLVL